MAEKSPPNTVPSKRPTGQIGDPMALKRPFFKHGRYNLKQIYQRVRNLKGDPHYVAMGMAVGVFIGVTPTFPFHTALAIGLAFLLRGSKPAAIIGVWFGNPVTMPFFYVASYKIGTFILGRKAPFGLKYESILELLKLGWDVSAAMLVGGIIIGLPPAIFFYFLTRALFQKIRRTRQSRRTKERT